MAAQSPEDKDALSRLEFPALYQPALGPVVIDSKVDEDFSAHIEFMAPIDVSVENVSVRMASEEEFSAHGIEYVDLISDLRVEVSTDKTPNTITLAADTVLPSPYIEFALVVDWLGQEKLFTSAVYTQIESPATPTMEPFEQRQDKLPNSSEAWIPAGFETLSEPQITEIDVWYGGYFLMSTLARFTFEELTFLDVDSIAQNVPGLIDTGGFSQLLERSFATNGELACRSQYQVDCGLLDTTDVNIIFNRNSFRATLFIAQNLIETTAATGSRYLPESSASLSAYNDTRVNFSGSDAESPTVNFNNFTQIALAENRLLVRSNWTDSEGLLVDTLGLQREYRGQNYQVGLMRADTTNLDFMVSEQFFGLSIESSLITRTDLDQSQGNEIVLFFSSRSRVEIYRDDRLLYTGYYDVGNRTLVTSSLPQGTYTIDIRVTDTDGVTTTEQRFYSKSARLAPTDQTLFFLQAGSVVSSGSSSFSPKSEDQLLRAGLSKRLSSSTGASIGFSQSASTTLIETSLFRQGKYLEISPGIAYESNGAMGVNLDLRLRWNKFFANIDARKIINTNEILVGNNPESRFQLGQDMAQYNASLNYNTTYGNLSFFYRENQRDSSRPNAFPPVFSEFPIEADTQDNKNFGIRWNNTGIRLGNSRLRLGVEWSKNNDSSLAVMSMTYNFRGDSGDFSFSPRYSHRSDASGANSSSMQGGANAAFQFGEDNRHRLNVRADRQNNSVLEARYESTGFNTSSNISTRYDMSAGRMNYNGELRTSFASAGKSQAFGASQSGESAFLINVNGVEDDSSEYEILINGSPKGRTKAGVTLLIPVVPYKTYRVEVRARGNQLINLQNNNYVKTVYPGNVIALDWTAEVVRVAYGRIVDEKGAPITNAVVTLPGNFSSTDAQGFFQVELGNLVKSLSVLKGGVSCQVNFRQEESKNLAIPLGALVCK